MADEYQGEWSGPQIDEGIRKARRTQWRVVSNDDDAERYERLLVDATDGVTITLPGSPEEGCQVEIADKGETFGDGLTIDGNGETINGEDSVTVSTVGARLRLIYTGSEWQLRSHNSLDDDGTQQQVVVVDGYLATEELI